MERISDSLENAIAAPLLVIPEHRGVGRQVSGQVAPVTAIFELVEDAIQDLSLCPVGRSRFLLLREEWLNDFPLSVSQVAGVRHFCPPYFNKTTDVKWVL